MEKKATRDALGAEVLALGLEHKDVFVIDCDVAKSCKTLEFAAKLPEQHINVGISEQNAVGIAAGLATTGKVPFVVTYAIFGSMRAVEQIRQETCYTKLNVKILCSHGGLTPANDGASHQCVEDMGILRTIPNMTVIMPADYNSARKLIAAAYKYNGPVYLRFTRDAIPCIYGEDEEFEIGKAKCLKEGKDLTIIATGLPVSNCLEAAEKLAADGIDAKVINIHTIKPPLDEELVIAAARETGRVVTVEEHSVIGGLGSAVCDVLSEKAPTRVMKIGINDTFGESGPALELLKKYGLDTDSIYAKIKAFACE